MNHGYAARSLSRFTIKILKNNNNQESKHARESLFLQDFDTRQDCGIHRHLMGDLHQIGDQKMEGEGEKNETADRWERGRKEKQKNVPPFVFMLLPLSFQLLLSTLHIVCFFIYIPSCNLECSILATEDTVFESQC